MTADREALKAAVLKALPVDPERNNTLIGFDVPEVLWQKFTPAPIWGDPEILADAIVDAVIAVDEREGTVEWSPRYTTDGSQMFAATFTEAGARRFVDESKGGLALYKRRCGPWERVD